MSVQKCFPLGRSMALRADRRCDLTPIIMFGAQPSGNAEKFNGFADMAEYDLNGRKFPQSPAIQASSANP
jgi:hypothetical protein